MKGLRERGERQGGQEKYRKGGDDMRSRAGWRSRGRGGGLCKEKGGKAGENVDHLKINSSLHPWWSQEG